MLLINKHNKNINFGYDKKLNKELKNNLVQYPDKVWANNLSKLNSQCNQLEDEIILREKETAKHEQKNSPEFRDFIDIFITLKDTLTAYVSTTFEDLNYADREAKHYEKALSKNKDTDSFRYKVLEKISEWMNNPDELETTKEIQEKKNQKETHDTSITQESEKMSKPKYVIDDDEDNDDSIDETEESNNSLESIKNKLMKNSLLEAYKTDSTSPKGFVDVAGMEELKKTLLDNVVSPINNPEQAQQDFEDYGKVIPKAILLYGPPGCGKTYITQALASEINGPLYMINIANIGSHYMNLTSKNLNNAINQAIEESEKTDRTTLLFIDEIDSMGYNRNSRLMPDEVKQVTSLLQGLDKAAKSKVMIISATNKYDLLDPALTRRFDHKILVDIPDEDATQSLIVHTLKPLKKAQKLLSNPNEIKEISKLFKGYSNKSVCSITKQAALNALDRNRADIEKQDFELAIEKSMEDKIDRKIYLSSSLNEKEQKIGFTN